MERQDDEWAPAPEQMPPAYPPESDDPYRFPPLPATEGTKKKRKRSAWVEGAIIVAVVLAANLVLKTFFLQAFEIPSQSMEQTLVPGDQVFANKLINSPDEIHRGDIIVFLDPGNWLTPQPSDDNPIIDGGRKVLEVLGLRPRDAGHHLVKRVIGIGGDHVVCCNDKGQIIINGQPINETYLPSGVHPSNDRFDVHVPKGYLWMMGDNRSNSKDSRYHEEHSGNGFVPVSNVVGRVWLRYFPFDRFGTFPDVSSVFKDVPAPGHEKADTGTDK